LVLILPKLALAREDLPEEILRLLKEAKGEVIVQNRKHLNELKLFPEKTFTCHNCNNIFPRNKIRLLFTKNSNSSYLYCNECRDKLSVGTDEAVFDGLAPVSINYEIGKAFLDK
jgi:transcription elongation factor Elf1